MESFNNYVLQTGKSHLLQWSFTQIGPNNTAMYIATLIFNGQVIGTGTAATRSGAKEAAAYQALRALGVVA